MYTNARCFYHCIKIKQDEVCYWHSQPEVQKLAEQERSMAAIKHLKRWAITQSSSTLEEVLISFIFVLLCLQFAAGVRGLFLFEDILEI